MFLPHQRLISLFATVCKLSSLTLLIIVLTGKVSLADTSRNTQRLFGAYIAGQKKLLRMKLEAKLLKVDEQIACETNNSLDNEIKCLRARSKTEKALAKIATLKLPFSPIDFNKDGRTDALDKNMLGACLAQTAEITKECSPMDLNGDKKLSMTDGVVYAALDGVTQFTSGITCQ